MDAAGFIYDLKLEHVFGISRESRSVQRTFIVALSSRGKTGYGEATENRYYNVFAEDLQSAFEDLVPFLRRYEMTHPAELWEEIRHRTGNFRFLMNAIDEAAWDLYGKLHGRQLTDLWQLPRTDLPVSSYTIGIDDIEVMQEKIREKPWPVYKIKLGTGNDEEIIRALREVTGKPFRVDANAAWTPEKTLRMAEMMKDLNVEFIEQPLPADAYADMRRIKDKLPLPVIADESCRTEADLEKCFDAFHGINVKLTKAGGLTPGKKMLEAALKSRKITMIGCMTESSVGISAAAQLLPLTRYADLDGPLLITNDPAEGVRVTDSGYVFPDEPGTGVRLKADL